MNEILTSVIIINTMARGLRVYKTASHIPLNIIFTRAPLGRKVMLVNSVSPFYRKGNSSWQGSFLWVSGWQTTAHHLLSVNKVLLAHSHALLPIYCLELLFH